MENTIEIINDDSVFIGTATEIIEQMRQQAYFERGIPLLDYLNRLPEFIKAYSGTDINLSGETLEERAASFIKELVKAGYFKEA
jgi:hypothetical protein